MAATVADLDAALTELSLSVDSLDARIKALPQPPAPLDLQPQVDAVKAIKAKVDAELAPPAA